MPLEPRSAAYNAAIEIYVADVEKTMREKLTAVGDYKNLAELETEIDRMTLRVELLTPDPEFAEAAKRIDVKRQELARKRDQMKPFLQKCEREIAIYRAAQGSGGMPADFVTAAAPSPVAAPFAPAAAAPFAPAAAAPFAAAAAPAPFAPSAAPSMGRAPAPPPVGGRVAAPVPPTPVSTVRPPSQPSPAVAAAWASAAPAADPFGGAASPDPIGGTASADPFAAPSGAVDMSLPEDDGIAGIVLAAPSDFVTGPGETGGADELLLGDEVPSPSSVEPGPSAAQWPPPGQTIPDPFAAFQPAAAPAPAPAAAAPRRPAPSNGAPVPAARPTGPAAAAPAPAPNRTPTPAAKPPWQK